MRIVLPWSQAHVPGINAKIMMDETIAGDQIITIPPIAVEEVRATFAAFCASIQQGDRHGCALLQPLFAKHGIVPAVTL